MKIEVSKTIFFKTKCQRVLVVGCNLELQVIENHGTGGLQGHRISRCSKRLFLINWLFRGEDILSTHAYINVQLCIPCLKAHV